MNYSLAKELKEAGFKHDWCGEDRACWQNPDRELNGSCVPTLEELIEACGEELWRLTNFMGSPATWAAKADGGEICTTGHTITEAVARLWLELNKKI